MTQQKTGAKVNVPVSPEVANLLAIIPRSAVQVIVNEVLVALPGCRMIYSFATCVALR